MLNLSKKLLFLALLIPCALCFSSTKVTSDSDFEQKAHHYIDFFFEIESNGHCAETIIFTPRVVDNTSGAIYYGAQNASGGDAALIKVPTNEHHHTYVPHSHHGSYTAIIQIDSATQNNPSGLVLAFIEAINTAQIDKSEQFIIHAHNLSAGDELSVLYQY